jgi:CDP-glucose 4,6-dehydratase
MGNWKRSLESMEMNLFSGVYFGKRVLITGHTGFKGSWLSLWLHSMGAEVFGIALPPEDELSHWKLLNLPIVSNMCDIRDIDNLKKIINENSPDIIFHLAAQPLVRKSYESPLETWSTNLMGTANVLELCKKIPNVQAIIVVTTDKCYKNQEWFWGYRESDQIGGHDPYSASKACVELLVESYRNSFFNTNSSPLLATVRAGNVIGGGDWSKERLIPDLVRAFENNRTLEIRSPNATRPWQHVLESLSGYLTLGEKLILKDKNCASAWNFGPNEEENASVSEVLEKISKKWKYLSWSTNGEKNLHETKLLSLDSSKAKYMLGWKPVWSLDSALEKTLNWYESWNESQNIISHSQIENYVRDASKVNLKWACN